MTDAIYDIRFAFKYDNPFENDSNRDRLKELKQYFASNQEKFTEIDYLNDSRYLMLCPNVTTLYGSDVTNGDVTNNQLMKEVKDFLKSVNGISTDLQEWCNEATEVAEPPPPSQTGASISRPIASDEPSPVESEVKFEPNIIPSMPPKFSQSLSAGLHYDISNDKSLSYDEVCKLCLNIARMKLVEENTQRDETVEALEREKRKKLTHEIMRYKSNKLIDPLIDADLAEMSLEQLETCLEQCINYQENFKTLELFKRGFSAGGTIYDAIFPDGIPISKNKRLCFKGVGKEILSTLFNATTTTGIAFQNILQKNNIHVSDELLTLVAFGEICLSKVEIKTVENEDDEDVGDAEEGEDLGKIVQRNSFSTAGADNEYDEEEELMDVDE